MFAVKTKAEAKPKNIQRLAQDIENSTKEHVVCAFVMQKVSDLTMLYAGCGSRQTVIKHVQTLQSRGYRSEVEPSGDFVVPQDTTMKFSMSEGMHFFGEKIITKKYHPKLSLVVIQPIVDITNATTLSGKYRGYFRAWANIKDIESIPVSIPAVRNLG